MINNFRKDERSDTSSVPSMILVSPPPAVSLSAQVPPNYPTLETKVTSFVTAVFQKSSASRIRRPVLLSFSRLVKVLVPVQSQILRSRTWMLCHHRRNGLASLSPRGGSTRGGSHFNSTSHRTSDTQKQVERRCM